MGRRSRKMCRVNKYKFLRTSTKTEKRVHRFQTGDLVKVRVIKGAKAGTYVGRVSVRKSGSFNISTSSGIVESISFRYIKRLHQTNGYDYK